MSPSSRPTIARIDLDAVASNFRSIERLLEDASRLSGRTPPGLIAVIKANAYGHGAGPVATALERAGARTFAVADIEEGVAVREAGITGRILVFGALGVSDLSGVFSHGLTPTISTPSAARALQAAAAARGVRLACQLKIDTGMHRLGFRDDNLRRTMGDVLTSRNLAIEAVYTHFATAEDVESDLFPEQRQRFDAARAQLASLGCRAGTAHAANSAALLRDERVWYDSVRAGLLLYGVVPPPLAATLPLTPALRLTSRVVAVKGLRAGEVVGYGGRYRAAEPRSIAVVPAGYADGLDRRLAGAGAVLVRGRRAPIVGAVSMDMMTIDVTGIDVNPGDEVIILGAQRDERIDAREMAAVVGTIPYELLCRLGSRIARQYCGSSPEGGKA